MQSVNQWINTMWSVYRMEHHGAIEHWVNKTSCIRIYKDANIYWNKKHMGNATIYRPHVGSKV